ncbi:16295_t:CDS:2, partial [Acaulospora colombiana]
YGAIVNEMGLYYLHFLRSKSMTSSGSPNDSPGPIVPRTRLLIKDVPDNHDDDDDIASTPRSSVRMEEVDSLDDEAASNSSNVPTPALNSTQSTTPQMNTTTTGNGSGYPFPDGVNNLPGGAFIPPGDALRMLQWLQQNQIFIPGYHPMDPNANTGTLTTLPNNANMFNPSALTHAFNNVHMNGQDVYDAPRMTSASNNVNQSQWTNPYRQSTVPSHPAMESSIAPTYPNSNQFLNTLLPLASMANEPPPPVNMTEVSRNSDKLDQLSNNVQAMEQGIDSLIEGIGLDPLSAASLRAEQANAALPNNSGVDMHAPSAINSQMNVNLGGQPQMGAGDGGDFTSGMSDFDLDTLLKQLGVAAAASTPPAIPFTDNFHPSTGLGDPYDPNLFNEVNVGSYGPERPIQDSSSTFLNENASTLMPTEPSSEPHSAFNTMEDVRNIRDRGTKRKSEAVSDDGINPTGSSTVPGDTNSGTTTPKAQVK